MIRSFSKARLAKRNEFINLSIFSVVLVVRSDRHTGSLEQRVLSSKDSTVGLSSSHLLLLFVVFVVVVVFFFLNRSV